MMRPQEILEEIESHFGLEPGDLRSRSRIAHIVKARQITAWIFRQEEYSLEAIGNALARDHSTVAHMLKRVEQNELLWWEASRIKKRIITNPDYSVVYL